MPDQWQSQSPAFVRRSKVCLPRDRSVHFDAIHPSFMQSAHRPARLRLIDYAELMKRERPRVEDWTRSNNPWPNQHSGFNLHAPLVDFYQHSTKVADARHPVRDERWQSARLRVAQMHVHVPQSREEKFPGPIDHLRVARKSYTAVFPQS